MKLREILKNPAQARKALVAFVAAAGAVALAFGLPAADVDHVTKAVIQAIELGVGVLGVFYVENDPS